MHFDNKFITNIQKLPYHKNCKNLLLKINLSFRIINFVNYETRIGMENIVMTLPVSNCNVLFNVQLFLESSISC